jgi:O-antigen/teichoic acid export membrane protein
MNGMLSSRPNKKQLLKNSIFNSSAWGMTVVVNLIAIPVLIRYLGVEGYGIYVLLTGLFGYFGLLDFGFVDGVVKYVAHHQELGDHDSLARSINAALLIQFVAGGIGVLVISLLNHRIISWLHVSPALFHLASASLYVSVTGFFAKMVLNTCNATLKGLQRFDLLAKTTVAFSLVTTTAIILVLIAGGRLLAVIVTNALFIIINLVVNLSLIYHCAPCYRLSLGLRRKDCSSLFSFGVYVFISRVASTLNSYFLQITVALILGPACVAYFAVPMRVISALESTFYNLIAVIFPYVSALRAQGDTESVKRLYSKASKYVVALSTPVFLFLILFSRQILTLWLGKQFSANAWPVLSLLGCASLVAVWTMVPANTIYGTGDTKIGAVFGSIVAGLNVLFSVMLTSRIGILGTGVAVLITAIQAPIFIWYVTGRVVGVSPAIYFERVFAFHLAPIAVFSLVSLGFMSLTGETRGGSSLVPLGFGIALSVFYYSFLLGFRIVSLRELTGAIGISR